jgi:hypothetical protein
MKESEQSSEESKGSLCPIESTGGNYLGHLSRQGDK